MIICRLQYKKQNNLVVKIALFYDDKIKMSVTQKNTKKKNVFLILRIHFYNIAHFILIIYIQIHVRIEASIFVIPRNRFIF